MKIRMLRDLPDRHGNQMIQGRTYAVPDTPFYRNAEESGYLEIVPTDLEQLTTLLAKFKAGLYVTEETDPNAVEAVNAAGLEVFDGPPEDPPEDPPIPAMSPGDLAPPAKKAPARRGNSRKRS